VEFGNGSGRPFGRGCRALMHGGGNEQRLVMARSEPWPLMALGHAEREGGGGGQVELGAETAACGGELAAPAPAAGLASRS
jgi:hypothetical protein